MKRLVDWLGSLGMFELDLDGRRYSVSGPTIWWLLIAANCLLWWWR